MGEAIAFDTHRFVKRLTDNGFTEAQAQTLADERVNPLNSNLATKQNLLELEAATKRDLAELKGDPQKQMAEAKNDVLKWMIGAMFAQAGVIVGWNAGCGCRTPSPAPPTTPRSC